MSKRYRGISDSQADAEAHNRRALEQRERPLSETHAASVSFNWHYETRVPNDLRGMVRAVRRAYADEVPTKLHEGPDSIGEGGTPKMAQQFVRYLDDPRGTDEPRVYCECDQKPHEADCPAASAPIVTHYTSPFKAALDRMEKAGPQQARRARMVRHITIGSQEPHLAAIKEGAHLFDAKLSAEDALRVFLTRYYSDLKVEVAA